MVRNYLIYFLDILLILFVDCHNHGGHVYQNDHNSMNQIPPRESNQPGHGSSADKMEEKEVMGLWQQYGSQNFIHDLE